MPSKQVAFIREKVLRAYIFLITISISVTCILNLDLRSIFSTRLYGFDGKDVYDTGEVHAMGGLH